MIVVRDKVIWNVIAAGRPQHYAITVFRDDVSRDTVATGQIEAYASPSVRDDFVADDGIIAGLI